MNVRQFFQVIRHLPKSVFFNLYYLPFKSACKLPIIFISSVKFACLKGKIEFSAPIRTGMVIIGGDGNVLYRHTINKCVWANYGGLVTFGDRVGFADGFAVEIGQHGHLILGNNIFSSPLARISCFDKVEIGSNTRFAWETIIMDTDFHATINLSTGKQNTFTKPVKIGKNNWLGTRSMVMKGTETPDFCIVSAYSLLNKRYDIPQYSLIGGIPAKFIKEGLYRDLKSHVNEIQQQKYDKASKKNIK